MENGLSESTGDDQNRALAVSRDESTIIQEPRWANRTEVLSNGNFENELMED